MLCNISTPLLLYLLNYVIYWYSYMLQFMFFYCCELWCEMEPAALYCHRFCTREKFRFWGSWSSIIQVYQYQRREAWSAYWCLFYICIHISCPSFGWENNLMANINIDGVENRSLDSWKNIELKNVLLLALLRWKSGMLFDSFI